jgi:hypothetical protein
MERKFDTRQDEPLELGTASAVTLGNHGFFPEKETTMLTGAISDD